MHCDSYTTCYTIRLLIQSKFFYRFEKCVFVQYKTAVSVWKHKILFSIFVRLTLRLCAINPVTAYLIESRCLFSLWFKNEILRQFQKIYPKIVLKVTLRREQSRCHSYLKKVNVLNNWNNKYPWIKNVSATVAEG